MFKKVLKAILIILGVIVILAAGLITWLSVTEFKPDPVMEVQVNESDMLPSASPKQGDTITVISWNIGYGDLGKQADFFMDGGSNVKNYDRDGVTANLVGISKTMFSPENEAAIYMIQEADSDSSRTYGIDEAKYLGMYNSTYALNYSCNFVPYPIPPMGKINSGILTTTLYDIDKAERISLPCPFSWPTRAANIKRCLLASYIPLQGSDKQLVVVNLHLEAYDSGEGKIAQTKQLCDFIKAEYEKGNYVIAGGDFNQIFPGGMDAFPNTHKELWTPGLIESDMLPDDWTLAYDTTVPTCRLLNQAYNPDDTANTQYYVIDGFIISPNVELKSVNTMDQGFEFSDHNPVKLQITLK